ncbi:hypothetical protein ACS0TY_024535 [Phlomoides rotata]
MISRVASMGHGYTGPNYHALRVPLLKEAKTQVNMTILSLRSKWAETGYTIMGDGWTDRSHRSLINFLVYCPYGLPRSFISYKWPLAWLRQMDGWTEIVTPGATRFGTNFIALKSLYDHKEHLEALVICPNYKKFLKTEKGRGVKDTVFNQRFWNNYMIVVKIMEPLMRLLRICDTDEKPSLGYVYEGLSRAIRGTKEIFNNQESKYKPFVDIINKRWDKMLRKRLHAAAYWLNHAFQYDPNNSLHNEPEAYKGLLGIIQDLHPDTPGIMQEIIDDAPNGELDYDELEELDNELANNELPESQGGNENVDKDILNDHIDLTKFGLGSMGSSSSGANLDFF